MSRSPEPARAGNYRANSLASRRARTARKLCGEAGAHIGPLDLERWTSSLLGQVWLRRPPGAVPATSSMLTAGRPVLQSLAEIGGTGARTALTAVARLDRGRLGYAAAQLAAAIDAPVADWLSQVGVACVVRAFSDCSPGDGEALLLEAEPVQDTPHMVAVFIDERLGGIAKHLALTCVVDPGDPDAPAATGTSLSFRPADPVLACARVREAIALTDLSGQPVDGEGFVDHRSLALARTTSAGTPHKPRRDPCSPVA